MKLRIGMIAPISHPLPPPGYGPWERVCWDLTEGLLELGHEVVLFGPEGSITSAELHTTVPGPLDAAFPGTPDARIWETYHIGLAMREAVRRGLDVVHSHLHVHALGYAPLLPMPLVTTLHGTAWDPNTHIMLQAYRKQPFVSLSEAERRLLPGLNYVATVNNGIRLADYPFSLEPARRLAFVGRMAPEKAPHLAIEVATAARMPLVLAGQVEARYQDYFEERVRPHLGATIVHLGDLDRTEVARILGGSLAMLMPLDWEEPFGLVAIESLAVGTPVVAWRRGALPEIVEHGVSGYLVDGVDEAVQAVARVGELDRNTCRGAAESRFGHLTMARRYGAAYQAAIDQSMAARSSATETDAAEIRVSQTP